MNVFLAAFSRKDSPDKEVVASIFSAQALLFLDAKKNPLPIVR